MKHFVQLFIIVFIVTSCGAADENMNVSDTVTSGVVNVDMVPLSNSSIEGELNIVTQMPSYQFEDQVRSFKAAYPSITVNVEKYDSFETYQSNVRVVLMSGGETEFDLFRITPEMQLAFGDTVYLTDLNGFIDSDEEFVREEYYDSMLTAAEINGKLNMFPTGSRNTYIFLNEAFEGTNVGELFHKKDTHSYESLLDIYDQLEDKENTYLLNNFSLHFIATNKPYIDFLGKQANYTSQEFKEIAIRAGAATHPNLNTLSSSGILLNQDEALGVSGATFLFGIANDRGSIMEFLPNNDLFSDLKSGLGHSVKYGSPKPLTSIDGEVFTGLMDCYALPEQAKNKEIAWLFLKFITSNAYLSNTADGFIHYAPLNKDINRTAKMKVGADIAKGFPEDRKEEALAGAIETIEYLLRVEELPKYRDGDIYIPDLYEIILDYHNQIISIDQMIERLDSVVTLYFSETSG